MIRDRALTRTGNPATSFDAADRVTPHMSDQQKAILTFLRQTPDGAGSKRISRATAIAYVSVSARVSELREAGHVEASGEREERGNKWRATMKEDLFQ